MRTEGRSVMVQRELEIRDFWLSSFLISQEVFSFGPHFVAKGRKKTCLAREYYYLWLSCRPLTRPGVIVRLLRVDEISFEGGRLLFLLIGCLAGAGLLKSAAK